MDATSLLIPADALNNGPVAAQSESWRVLCWRLAELSSAGYSDDAAALLASLPDIDLHQAIDLLGSGCTHETALRILL